MINLNKIANNFSNKNRANKYQLFLNRFSPNYLTKILDVGAAAKEYRENTNILEKRYPYSENITVLGIAEYEDFRNRYPKIKVVKYEGGKFPFNDRKFDIVWCNAVIEHVGDIGKQKQFLSEINRVATHAFITTPNKYFPFEVHSRLFLLHYLPKDIFDRILLKLGKPWVCSNRVNLLGLRDIKLLLEKCRIQNYSIIKNKIFGFTVDFMILW